MMQKNKLLAWIRFLVIAVMFSNCTKETTPTPLIIQKPFAGSPEYFKAIRTYKASDHPIAFGWFGGWVADGPLSVNYLSNLPDSMDMVSIWGNAYNLTPSQIKDKNDAQKIKALKVLFTFIVANIGDDLGGRAKFPGDNVAAIKAYAKAIADTVNKYHYDGFDCDYEPHYGAPGNIASYKDSMAIFITELAKYLGPKSGSGKILMVDGEPEFLREDMGDLIDYYTLQAYTTTSPVSLQSRVNALVKLKGFNSKKVIITENFESFWSTGGVSYADPVYGKIPSLLGMAYFNPSQGRKGGIGAYHFEYEYPSTPDFKYMRQAIQIMNPAVQ